MSYQANQTGTKLSVEEQLILAELTGLGTPGQAVVVNPSGTGLTYETISGSTSLVLTDVKVSNYTANPSEFVVCDISSGGFQVKLPNAPVDGTIVIVKIIRVGVSNVLQLSTQGTDVFTVAGGNTSLYMQLAGETNQVQYKASNGTWYIISTAAPSNFAIGFPGIDATTPIDNTAISIDTTSRVLTVTPPLGYFNIYVDGGGVITRFRKTGTVNFPAFTDTSGTWYFYFDSTGTPITTQTPWNSSMFPAIATLYRIVWNATLTGADKLVAQYVEYHQNDIPADTHAWFHLYGAIWESGFDFISNLKSTGAPAANGSNTVIALKTGSNRDDNLEYTITNDTTGNPWTQDMGNITPASLNATNSGQFKTFVQNGSGLISFLPATRFPFPWNASTNVPQYITSTGTRTDVSSNYYFTVFAYSIQNPIAGNAIKVVTSTSEYSTIINARAVNWVDIQNTYSILNEGEIRPLYKMIFEVKYPTYDVGAKYAVLREVTDLRKAAVTSTSTTSGSLPASSVTFVPYDGIASTNVQSALQEIADERVPYTGASANVNLGYYDLTANLLDSKQLDLESYPCLQGTAESQVQLPNTGSRFNFGANDFTITFHRYSDIKTASTGNGTYLAVNYPQTYDGSHGYPPISIGGSGVGNDRLYVTTDGFSTAFVKDIPIKYDEWQYIVITRNGNTWEIWVDNVLKVTWTSSITVWDNGTNGTNVMSSWYTNFMNKGFFIKELNFYNIGFSPTDISTYYNSGKGKFGLITDTGLVGGFHFNNSLVDYKGVGNGSWVGNAFYSNSNFALEGDTTSPTINTVKILDSQFLLNKGIKAKYGYFEDMGGTSPYAVKGVSSNTTAVIGQLGYYDGTINYGVHTVIGSSNNIAGRFASESGGVWVNIVDKYNTGSPFAINAYGKSQFSDGSNTVLLTDGTYAINVTAGKSIFNSAGAYQALLGDESNTYSGSFGGTGVGGSFYQAILGYGTLQTAGYFFDNSNDIALASASTPTGRTASFADGTQAGLLRDSYGNRLSICDGTYSFKTYGKGYIENYSGGSSLQVYNSGGTEAIWAYDNSGNDVKIATGAYAIDSYGYIRLAGLPSTPINPGELFITDVANAIVNNYNVVCIG